MRSPPLPPGAAWASSGWSVHRRLGGSSTCCCGPTGTPSRQVRAAFGLASPCRLGATSDGHPGDRADNRRSPSPHQGAGCPVALLSAGSQPGDGRRGRAAPGSRRGARGHQPEPGSSSAAMPRRAQSSGPPAPPTVSSSNQPEPLSCAIRGRRAARQYLPSSVLGLTTAQAVEVNNNDRQWQTLEGEHAGQRRSDGRQTSSRSASITATTTGRIGGRRRPPAPGRRRSVQPPGRRAIAQAARRAGGRLRPAGPPGGEQAGQRGRSSASRTWRGAGRRSRPRWPTPPPAPGG